LTDCVKKRILSCNVRHWTRRPVLKALRMARADAGLTISELAKRAGVSRDTISTAERGHHSLQAATLNKLARALNKTPSALLAEEERLAPKAESRSSLEPSLFNGIEDERPESLYAPWLEYVNRFADRWDHRIARGVIDQGALDEFTGTMDDLLPILSRLGLQEKQEKPEESEDSTFGPITDEAIGRLFSLFNPLIEAGVKQEEGSDLAHLRRRREEMLDEQARAASG
jgi:transcriptional regulator with XRE-family HTH domain